MSGPARARSPRTRSADSGAAPPGPATRRRAARRPGVAPSSPSAPTPATARPRPAPARPARPGLDVDPGAPLHPAILLLIATGDRPRSSATHLLLVGTGVSSGDVREPADG